MKAYLHEGKTVCLGKHPARYDARTLKLTKYLPPNLPDTAAARDLSMEIPWDDDVLGNTDYSDCTCAALGHMLKLLQTIDGVPISVTTQGVLDAYSAVTGFDPSVPSTDNGANMLDVLKYARSTGICGAKIKAFMSFNPLDRRLMRAAVDLFGGAYLGLALPLTAQDQDVWSSVPGMVPGSWGGHAASVISTSPVLDCINTWGAKKPVTPSFETSCADEAYVLLWEGTPPPAGLDTATLQADLALLR